ncbi:MAG: pyridoxal phosphate-dependent aminotransferase [Candidatus Stygibacter australis]|nr:pyridoxal phosphate-dependent aminotransferase [Candidatus Stygibacter australis]MDP8322072.1 pyridoxal phosphate-dependent aminotransferase [Candidatus Stygibacter australis]
MQLSNRALNIQASPIRKLVPLSNAAKAAGKHVYHLNIGQPDIETPQEMMNVYREFDQKILAYGPSQGLKFYRQNLVKYYSRYGIQLNEDEIIITTAGSEACFFAMLAVCNHGDEIIIPEPFYTNYNGFATWAGVNIAPLTTKAENGFALPDVSQIEKLINDNTRAVMICNPGNPTGAVYTRDELLSLAQLAIKYDLFLISDEVYREFVYDGESHTSILTIPEISDRAIVVDSISKRYSACGARIGCIITHNQILLQALIKFAQARLCPPTIEQYAANACIDLQEEYFAGIISEYQARRDLVFDALSKIDDVICVKPKGAFYIIVKLPIDDAEHFVKWLLTDYSLNNETVMVAPAAGFYASPGLGKDEVRIAYILNKSDLKIAMEIFSSGLIEYLKK